MASPYANLATYIHFAANLDLWCLFFSGYQHVNDSKDLYMDRILAESSCGLMQTKAYYWGKINFDLDQELPKL